MKTINRILPLIFSVFFIASVHAANLQTPSSSTESLNSVVAVVNDGVITQSQLNQSIASAKQQMIAGGNPHAVSDTKLRGILLQQLIDQKLQLELAQRAHMTVTDAQVELAIQHIAASNHLTIAQLKDKLHQQNLHFAAYKKTIHDQILLHQVEQNAVGEKVHVTPQDIQTVLAQYKTQMKTQQSLHVIDILSSTKVQAQNIIMQLKKGANINSVAPNNTTDLGWQTANTLPTVFLQQLSTMQTGDVAGPIQAPNGFHVIKLVAVKGQTAALPTKEQLQNMAYEMKMQKEVKIWLKTLRKTAYIKIT
ncbi:MAG: SurA N-terminal domain-containing protein [Gammaproteobacteria bacterium]|nr:SurA N-terminal domain-containing protein [Gammaproteobacteria bacterium]